MRPDFIRAGGPDPHVARRRRMLAAHPELRALSGRNPWTAAWIVGLAALHWASAALVAEWHWALIALAAYAVGAFVVHAFAALIHECAHALVTGRVWADRLLGMVCDVAVALPTAAAFRKYHLMHHRHMGDYRRDADIATRREGRVVGRSPWRKALWVAGLALSQALRPLKAGGAFWDPWILASFGVVIASNALAWAWLGGGALAYLLLSTVFGLGLHPVGGRWLQEHYVTRAGQETYSYYGPLNWLAFNVGYHNEHHDFPSVPWNRLPALRRAAPEFYDTLASYRSWSGLVWRFIRDPELTLFSRMVRRP